MTYDFISLDFSSETPLYQQLYRCIGLAIEQGHLKKGVRMPSIRRLSEDLRISRTTVESAYQQLCVEGTLRSEPQRGYFVAAGGSQTFKRSINNRCNFIKTSSLPDARYNFGTDSIDREYTDMKIWSRNIRNVLNQQDIISSYGEPQGEFSLRQALSSYSYGMRGVIAAPDQIVIGAGIQPLLTILCGLLAAREIAIENTGFIQAEQIFTDCGVRPLHIPSDKNGISISALYASGAKQVLVSPSFSVASGTAMPTSRRFELLRWAKETSGILIEDDYNGELRYNARPIPALQGMGGIENTVYLGSFSKLLLPSVRVSYMVLPLFLLEKYQMRSKAYNQTASKIEQLALAEYISEGQMERHLRRLRKLYAEKSQLLQKLLQNAFPEKITISLQETSLYFLLTLPFGFPVHRLADTALREQVRVIVQSENPPCIKLGFAGIAKEDIPDAVDSIKRAWKPFL